MRKMLIFILGCLFGAVIIWLHYDGFRPGQLVGLFTPPLLAIMYFLFDKNENGVSVTITITKTGKPDG